MTDKIDNPPAASWHSVLFIPANNRRFVTTAHTRSAGAIILDLEDSIAPRQKDETRASVARSIELLNDANMEVIVRLNRELELCLLDLEAVMVPGIRAVCIPKVMGADHLRLLDEVITRWELKRKLPSGSVGILPLVETMTGLKQTESICLASPRNIAMALGSEDLALDGGFEPTPENLFSPCQNLIFAARSAGLPAYGFPGSIANIDQMESFRTQIQQAKSMGFAGAFCIHPRQIEIVNDVFQPTAEQLRCALELVSRFENLDNQHLGVFEYKGQMIDLPVVERARRLLQKR